MNIIRSIYGVVSLPIRRFFYFFLTVLALHALVDVVFFYIYWRYSLQVVLNGFLLAYVLTVPCLWLAKHNVCFRLYQAFVFIPYIISFIGEVVSHAILDSSLDIDVAATILATNKEEALECIETYFSVIPILIGIGILGLTFILYRRLQTVRPRWTLCWLAGVVMGLGITLTTPMSGWGGVLGKIGIFHEAKTPIDINRYARVPDIKVDATNQPANVVLIIGESLNKLNCSTYGYAKSTTPRLEQLMADSLLIRFNDVTSSEVHTLQVFKTLFSQYRNEWEDSVKWYTCPTLQSVLHQSGYKTFWVSNQSKRGVSDNFIGQYAELCTENYFVGNKLAGMKRKTYDEDVIPLLKPLLVADSSLKEATSTHTDIESNSQHGDNLSAVHSGEHNFYVVHLMGSHFKFAKRYPKEFDHFQGEDYPNLSSRQRQVVATYDNSVLYNDSVVSEIMQLFADKEAVVFYFSDHAIDLYQSSSSYYGHAKKTKESFHFGQLIPFYVYVTPKYQARYPEVVSLLRKNVDLPFCTDNMFYTVMDLIGTSFNNSDDVKEFSLIRQK